MRNKKCDFFRVGQDFGLASSKRASPDLAIRLSSSLLVPTTANNVIYSTNSISCEGSGVLCALIYLVIRLQCLKEYSCG